MSALTILVLSLALAYGFNHVSIPVLMPLRSCMESDSSISNTRGSNTCMILSSSNNNSPFLVDSGRTHIFPGMLEIMVLTGPNQVWLNSSFCPPFNESDQADRHAASPDFLSIGFRSCKQPVTFGIGNQQFQLFNGSIRLGPGSPVLRDTLANVLKNRNSFAAKVFSFRLLRDRFHYGSLTFGGWDDAHRSGPIDWFIDRSKANATHWSLTQVSLKWGRTTCETFPAILDPGSPYIIGPEHAVYELLNDLGADARGKVPCSRKRTMPKLHVKIQNKLYRLKPESVIQAGPTGCYIAIKPAYNASKWVLGSAFMSNFKIIINLEDTSAVPLSSPGNFVSIGIARREDPSSQWYQYANFYVYAGGVILAILVVIFYYLYRVVKFISPLREDFPVSPSMAETSTVTNFYPIPKAPPLHSADAPFGFRLRNRLNAGHQQVSPSELSRLLTSTRQVQVPGQAESSQVVRSIVELPTDSREQEAHIR